MAYIRPPPTFVLLTERLVHEPLRPACLLGRVVNLASARVALRVSANDLNTLAVGLVHFAGAALENAQAVPPKTT
jgi:hypothetical protein